MDCTCPDWEVPCKHLAATFYLPAETFDEDPFKILAWRARDRDRLLETLSMLRSDGDTAEPSTPVDSAIPLTDCLDTYFVLAATIPPRPEGGSTPNDI